MTAATVVAIGGSVLTVFLSVGLWLSNMGFATPGTTNGRGWTAWFVVTGIITVLAPPFLGGAAWGASVAHAIGAPLRPAATTGALVFGGMIVITAAPTDITQLWLDDLPEWMPYGVHGYFTIVFMAEVGIVASVATWRLTRRLGLGPHAATIGLRTGIAAAVGFLAGSTIAFHIDYEVIPWQRLSMVWATVIAFPACTLASGCVLGWHLTSRHRVRRPPPIRRKRNKLTRVPHRGASGGSAKRTGSGTGSPSVTVRRTWAHFAGLRSEGAPIDDEELPGPPNIRRLTQLRNRPLHPSVHTNPQDRLRRAMHWWLLR